MWNILQFFSFLACSAMAIIVLPSVAISQENDVNPRKALPFPAGISLESQCGVVDDLQHVEFYDGMLGVPVGYVEEHEASTVQLQWLDESRMRERMPDYVPGNIEGVRWCTGTLFDDRHVLTAGHCFDTHDGSDGWLTPWRIDESGDPEYAEPTSLAQLQVVNFKFQRDRQTGANRTPDTFPVIKLVEYRQGSDSLDYAIVELARNDEGILPGERYAPAMIAVRDGVVDGLLTIIQHPQGDPKKIEAGKLLSFDIRDLFYSDIDTHGGSSGAGVRDSAGAVIGVHTNGGCVPDVLNSANRGVSMTAIAAVSDIF
ncbi:MAG: trypsin-like serine protease [Mesorhizobium sp.]|uniref:trypsin-like serine peptidase n=1 Tax=Mesorhizobium sp. TaxID=1871066 RepID=UPI0011F63BDC|nr:serine protease [Mesorhizobium sp.]TIL96303.1 MAG: trypsin-like serine protease [Mesorhizobium sp.]